MKLVSKGLLLTFFCLSAIKGFSQEMLFDLTSNPRLGAWEEAERHYQNSSRAVGDTLHLPFFDDFSEPFSRVNNPFDLYPSLDRWMGRTVYVNNHMAINPISQGVATFDGLDENGKAYGFGFALPSLSDSLTSKPINLFGAADSVYLSFFYQAQGMGDAPEADDILVLEFKDTSEAWVRVWEAEGYILEDFLFNREMIPVFGEEYLFSGFQFRFINYSSRSGSIDHWHLDYIELDENRFENDTTISDVSFMSQTSVDYQGNRISQSSSIIKEYNSMPWTHFITDIPAFMADSSLIALRNNKTIDFTADHSIEIRDFNGVFLYSTDTAGTVVQPNVICGNEINNCPSMGVDNLQTIVDFDLPTGPTLSVDSTYFQVIHQMNNLGDDIPVNNRNVTKQEFYNYYAYDDGTAEVAYGLGNLETPGFVAVRYEIKKEDDLQAIQIYLNPVGEDVTTLPVKLMVWDGPDEPTDVLYESPEFITLSYSDGINYFYNYPLENDLTVGETILWIGWRQEEATGVKFSVGFDKRTDNSDKVFYNLGTTWNQSSIPGSVMIRPVFGQPFDWVSGVDENKIQSLSVYPNPANGNLRIQEKYSGQFSNSQISIFDLTGREVFSQTGYSKALDVSQLIAGIYLLQVQIESGEKLTERVVIQP
ncbi:MAG: hypothetical protein ACI85G_000536 [Psychroserpens sp.]|jgi:hypothetical protein